ncbi:hypothetical protein SUGI_0631870 [Cryptomeria japonica]|uniref:trihelix transcription factor ASR3-like n=1 Tax=Cryptomeria japonica TaxID=3369 RepID=UPI00241494EF|nr:trihelix transcription factor ASR3-like [Cryptomeria japonica]GLJ31486.1 hypothetical protein SUGI_0631870 [Cryptomeria japonica]
MKKATTSTEKWKIVQEYCSHHGVFRTANQCRDQWEHIFPDFKRIRDYETHIPSGHDSYWNMTSRERVEKRLPPNFPKELMDAMEINFGSDRAIDPGNITIDTSDNNSTSSDRKYYSNENVSMDEFDTVNAPCQGSINSDMKQKKATQVKSGSQH